MVMNCLCTAGYVLYMKHATKTVRLSKFGMVFYNNLLSLPILAAGAALRGEYATLAAADELHTVPYLTLSLYAGVVGFFLNLATLWCVSNNSATTYAVVGALNKVPLAIIGCVRVLIALGRWFIVAWGWLPVLCSIHVSLSRRSGGSEAKGIPTNPTPHAKPNQTQTNPRWLLFQTPITGKALIFLSLSMCGGFLYTYTKLREQQRQPASTLPR